MTLRGPGRGLAAVLLVGLFSLTAPTIAGADPGALDPTFGNNGEVVFAPAGRTGDTASGIAIQPDEKILVAGTVTTNQAGTTEAAVIRLNPDGSLDPSFGNGGTALISAEVRGFKGADAATAIALQPDGKIVVAAFDTCSCGDAGEIYRLNSSGTLDTTFAAAGIAPGWEPLPSVSDPKSVALDGDGRITIVGSVADGAQNDWFAERLLSDGTLDREFNPPKLLTDGTANAVAIAPDGKIVIAGSTKWDTPGTAGSDMAVVRLATDGSFDTTFGEGVAQGGVIIYGFPEFTGSDDVATSLVIQPDGKIDVAGHGMVSNDFIVTRLTASGTLDNALNGANSVSADFGGDDLANAIALQSNGRIVLAGGADNTAFGLLRVQADGELDTTFGPGGKQTFSFSQGAAVAQAMALQPDGKIVVAGNVGPDFGVVRLLGDAPGGGGSSGGGSGGGVGSGSGGSGGGSGLGGSGGGGSGSGGHVVRRITVAVDNQRITLSTSASTNCLAAAATITASLHKVVIAGLKGPTANFAKASFFIDKGIRHVHHRMRVRHGHKVQVTTVTYAANHTTARLPATVALRLRGLKRGRHTLKVMLVFHETVRRNGDRHTVQVKKTLKRTFTIC